MKYRRKPAEIEAITFDELVAHGLTQTDGHDGVPWSFSCWGHPITHEDDDCYLVPIQGEEFITDEKFHRGMLLAKLPNGALKILTPEALERCYIVIPCECGCYEYKPCPQHGNQNDPAWTAADG